MDSNVGTHAERFSGGIKGKEKPVRKTAPAIQGADSPTGNRLSMNETIAGVPFNDDFT